MNTVHRLSLSSFFYSSLSELNLMLGELVLAPELIKDNLILPPHQLKRLFQGVAPDWSSPSPFLSTVFKLLMPAHEAQSYQTPEPPWGIPIWLRGKELACQCRRFKRCGFNPWVGKIPWGRKWQPTPVFLPGKSQGQRSLAATVHGVAKSWTQLSHQTTSDLFLTCSVLVIPAFFVFHAHTNLLPQGLCTCCTSCLECPPPDPSMADTYPSFGSQLRWHLLRESIPDCSIYETPVLTSLFFISPFYLLHGTYDKLKFFKL